MLQPWPQERKAKSLHTYAYQYILHSSFQVQRNQCCLHVLRPPPSLPGLAKLQPSLSGDIINASSRLIRQVVLLQAASAAAAAAGGSVSASAAAGKLPDLD